jgi:hypothetical protein
MSMKFLVSRSSEGSVSKKPPCKGAARGPEADAWPGEYSWYVEVRTLEELIAFLQANDGALGLFTPEDDEEYPMIQIFDDDQDQ